MPEVMMAPWRLKYIEKTDPKGEGTCIFVDLPAANDDEANLILYRGERAFVMLNGYPYSSGHLMVAPYQHTADLADLDDYELLEIQQLITRSVGWLKRAYDPNGFNIGLNLGKAAGAGIPDHLHWHIVPRWEGDTNFMTVTGNTRVIPQSLAEAYERLRSARDQS